MQNQLVNLLSFQYLGLPSLVQSWEPAIFHFPQIKMSGSAHVDALLKLINSSASDALAEYDRSGGFPTLDNRHPLDDAPAGDDLQLRKVLRVLEGAYEQLLSTLRLPSAVVIDVSRPETSPWIQACSELRSLAFSGPTGGCVLPCCRRSKGG
jgi:hypothetical protein